MSRYIRLDDAIATIAGQMSYEIEAETGEKTDCLDLAEELLNDIPTIDAVSVVRCGGCRKSHIDGKTTHYLWCTEWGRSTDTFGYCERGEREVE